MPQPKPDLWDLIDSYREKLEERKKRKPSSWTRADDHLVQSEKGVDYLLDFEMTDTALNHAVLVEVKYKAMMAALVETQEALMAEIWKGREEDLP